MCDDAAADVVVVVAIVACDAPVDSCCAYKTAVISFEQPTKVMIVIY